MRRRKIRSKKKLEEIADAESKESKEYVSQYRCTLQGIQTLYKDVKIKFKKGHHDAIEKTPFKHFFKALHDDEIVKEKKKDALLDNLILCYDRKTKKFKIGSEFYKPTRLDVKLIFGIEDGTKNVGTITNHGRGETELEARHFANVGRLSAKKVKDKIKELVDNEDQESIDDTVKLLCVILLHSVLFSNTGAHIAKGFLYYVDDFDRLNSYDWSQHVLDELMNGLHDDWSNPKQVNGCILLLPYWFCEHSNEIQDMYKNGTDEEPMKKGVQEISSKGIPRITKWKLKKLEKLVEKCVLYKEDKKWFNNNELKPTIAEEYLIKSLNGKRKAKKIVIEQDLDLEQSPADDETLVDLMKRKYKRLKLVKKKKEESSGDGAEGPGVESGCSSEGNQESEATQVEKDIESAEEPRDNSEGKSNAEAEKACDESMKSEFDTSDIPMSENVEEPRDSSKEKSIAEARKVHDQSMECGFDMSDILTFSLLPHAPIENTGADQDKPKKKKELGKTVTVLGKRKERLTKENIKEKNDNILKEVIFFSKKENSKKMERNCATGMARGRGGRRGRGRGRPKKTDQEMVFHSDSDYAPSPRKEFFTIDPSLPVQDSDAALKHPSHIDLCTYLLRGKKGSSSHHATLIDEEMAVLEREGEKVAEELASESPLQVNKVSGPLNEITKNSTSSDSSKSESGSSMISCHVKEKRTKCNSFNLSEVAIDDDVDGVESSIGPTSVDVKGYRVRPETAPVLHQILEQQGDIAKDCKAVKALRGCLLEKVCYVYEKLQSSSFQEIKRGELLEMEEIITGLEHMGLNVKWLSEKLDDILEVKVFLKVFAKKNKELKKTNDQLATLNKTVSVLEEEITKMKTEEVIIQKVRNLLNNPLVD